MEYKFQVQLGYHDIYPNAAIPSINDLLCQLSRKRFIDMFTDFRENYINIDIREVIDKICSKGDWPYGRQLKKEVQQYIDKQCSLHPEIEKGRNILICDVTLLELLRQEFAVQSSATPPSEQKSLELFCQAILLINDKIFDLSNVNDEELQELLKEHDDQWMEQILLANNFSFYSFTGVQAKLLALSELVKYMELCQFCRENADYSNYMQQFLTTHNIASTHWYGYKNLAIYNAYNKHRDVPLKLTDDYAPDYKMNINEIISLKDNQDYIAFRDRPLLECMPNHYLLINYIFLIQKIYSSVVFQLMKASGLKPQQFFGDYDKRFSEEFLFYHFMQCIFGNINNAVCITGKQMEEQHLIKGEPDYYVRIKNSIFVFEHKDVRIKADLRMAREYKSIRNTLFSKFVKVRQSNGKESKLGVSQLADNVQRILQKEFPFDKDYNSNRVTIYPILVIADSQFNQHGINSLLAREFRDITNNFGKYVSELTVIDMNTLILFSEKLSNGKIRFADSINQYHNYLRHYKSLIRKNGINGLFDRFISYADFMLQLYPKYKLRKLLNEFRAEFLPNNALKRK